MKSFFKYVLATITGLLLLFFLMIVFIGVLASVLGSKTTVDVKDNSLLKVSLNYKITDRGTEPDFSSLDPKKLLELEPSPGLNDILRSLEMAKNDERIKGIYLNLSSLQAGIATIDEIRHALLDFKSSGKFIYSYSESYSQKSYYLASVADSIFINPEGILELYGLNAELMFVKNALDKLGIEPQIIRYGKFKSATEPLTREDMSESNRKQIAEVLDDIWLSFLTKISASRNIPIEKLQEIADGILLRKPSDAISLGLADRMVYKDELIATLLNTMDVDEEDDLNLIELKSYRNAKNPVDKKFTRDKVTVIYAMGAIGPGNESDTEIGSEAVSKLIREAREDENTKAIVFRVNSGGGDALASDVIWREAKLAAISKPFIVSMGDVAASGGYYISCAADTIVAGVNTITGSIGVFGVIFNAKEFLNEKLGLTFDSYATAENAGLGSVTRPLTNYEREVIQSYVDDIYMTFTTKVAEGRGMEIADVDSIGQGRVWSGADAKTIGLVDVHGGLNDAIRIAAKSANIDNYRLKEVPKTKTPLEKIMKDMNTSYRMAVLKAELGPAFEYYKTIKETASTEGILARIPFNIIIN